MKYEIQLKGLLEKEQYEHLLELLPQQFTFNLSGTLQQTRYRSTEGGSGDVRLRKWYSSDGSIGGAEIILKEDARHGVAAAQRTERKGVLSIENIVLLEDALSILHAYHDPPWTKHKTDFTTHHGGHTYRLSLQKLWGLRTEFGYVLEGSIKIPDPDDGIHIQTLRTLFENLGVKPTPPEEFMARVSRFIMENSVETPQ